MATGDVTVTQADRERMAAYANATLHPGSRDIGGVHAAHIVNILAGGLDNGPLMQALAAHRLAAIPDGWRLVPIEPTDALKRAGDEEQCRCANEEATDSIDAPFIYRAMLDAAPEPQP